MGQPFFAVDEGLSRLCRVLCFSKKRAERGFVVSHPSLEETKDGATILCGGRGFERGFAADLVFRKRGQGGDSWFPTLRWKKRRMGQPFFARAGFQAKP
jgi:hypothetical protein